MYVYVYVYVYVYIYIYIYSTICRHACFGVLRLVSAAWYTSRYAMTFVFVYMQLALPSACTARYKDKVQHGPSTHPDMRRVSWGQSAQTTTRLHTSTFIIFCVDTFGLDNSVQCIYVSGRMLQANRLTAV